jgi:antirestriction protein ArdC
MTNTDQQTEALDRARTGQTMTNYPAIFVGFREKGIADSDIKPRENIFTFNAWKALGRSVRKGEHGVKVVTFIDCAGKTDIDQSTGETKSTNYRKPHTTTVFHVSQTEPSTDREARQQASGRTERKSWQRRERPTEHIRDPGEDAADRWNETHY